MNGRLTKRQLRFLKEAATERGCVAWDTDAALRNDELAAVRSLVAPDESSERIGVVWRTNDLGRLALSDKERE